MVYSWHIGPDWGPILGAHRTTLGLIAVAEGRGGLKGCNIYIYIYM